MTHLTDLEISGVNFTIGSRDPIILREPDSVYLPFIRKKNTEAVDVDITISIDLTNMPNTDKMPKVFDSGQSWSMFQYGDGYCLTLKPPHFEQFIWLAKISPDFLKIKIYCGNKFARRKNGSVELSNPVSYPLDQILLMYILAKRQGALLHAAGIDINGKGYIFPGRSGAGKSTITKLFAEREDIRLLSDDRIAVRKINGRFKAFGTPWPGDAEIALNKSVPLSGIFFINHGVGNTIKVLKPREAVEKILPVTSIPWYDKKIMPGVLDFCEDLISHIPVYELHFKPGVEVIDVFNKFISN